MELDKASTNKKCHFAISWARSCQYQCLRKSLSKYSTQFKEIGPFSLFQYLALGKASTDDKCNFAVPWARYCQYQCVCQILSKYSKRFKSWISLFLKFVPRQNLGQSQMSFDYLMGYIMSISMYHNTPPSSRDRAIFTFSEFEPRPIPNDTWQSLGLHLVNINAYAKFYQNIPNGLELSTFFRNRSVTKSSQTVRWQNQMFDYRALYESTFSLGDVQYPSYLFHCIPITVDMT